MCLNDANQPTASLELLKKLSGSQEPQIAYWIEKLDIMLSQENASQNSRQMIDNISNDLQPFACIMTKRFDNTQKINLAIISGKRIKKNVEKRQHKIKQKTIDKSSKRQSK